MQYLLTKYMLLSDICSHCQNIVFSALLKLPPVWYLKENCEYHWFWFPKETSLNNLICCFKSNTDQIKALALNPVHIKLLCWVYCSIRRAVSRLIILAFSYMWSSWHCVLDQIKREHATKRSSLKPLSWWALVGVQSLPPGCSPNLKSKWITFTFSKIKIQLNHFYFLQAYNQNELMWCHLYFHSRRMPLDVLAVHMNQIATWQLTVRTNWLWLTSFNPATSPTTAHWTYTIDTNFENFETAAENWPNNLTMS